MPALPLDAQIGKNIATLQFLCDIPILEITPPLAEDECVICKDSYRTNGWKLGGTVHRPVRLRCGHIFGFQCLARWMMTANSVARCPLCRVQVIKPHSAPAIPECLSNMFSASLARLETLAIVAGSGISQAQRTRLLESQTIMLLNDGHLGGLAHGRDRIMVAWEELLNSMCKNGSAAPREIQTRRQPLVARAVATPANDQVTLVLSQTRIQIALYFSFMAVAYVLSSPMWESFLGRADTFTATILSIWLGLGSTILAYNLWRCDVWWRLDMAICGAMSGAVLAGVVRLLEQGLHEWWMKGKYVEYTVYY